ncbi:hypothetical protein ABZW30_07025 [Kitasatospora sp. NPDC004669]|uniref:hypothetical protein n=1 Tax=Kitasatospora sp. NPDC004669 TaxID=3154555 RepID=UPI0033B2EC1A
MLHEDQPARPWGTVTPDFWAVADESGWADDEEALGYEEPAVFAAARASLPGNSSADDFARRFAELATCLNRPCTDAELALAAQDAGLFDQNVTAALGPADSNIASVRELRGLIARRQGHHTEAARWHLHTAGLHVVASGVSDPRARASAKHTLADWRDIPDPAERAAVAREILPMLTAIAGPGAKPTKEVQAYLEAHCIDTQ